MIVLASTSPTRQTLLQNAGVKFSAVAPLVDERQLVANHPHWPPDAVSRNLAAAKSLDVSIRYPEALVIGADQVLAHNGAIYTKPLNVADCKRQLSELRGQAHQLISSVACSRGGVVMWELSDSATLTMRNFSDDFLDDYINKNSMNCLTSVGGYQIEGPGLQLFDAIDGNYFTILGLPLLPLLDHLRAAGELAA